MGQAVLLDDPLQHLRRRSLLPQFGRHLLERGPTPAFALRSVEKRDTYVRFEVRLAEGNQDYDVMGYSKEQLIADALDQYERYLEFLRVRHDASTRSNLPDHRPDAPDAHLPEQ
ncbi:hypothetical protein [Streptomyces nigra]|uniref:hypothetical protein n=1 Tax=Streptomyces nigra TaxID=1827580 RepID=UPI0030CE136C